MDTTEVVRLYLFKTSGQGLVPNPTTCGVLFPKMPSFVCSWLVWDLMLLPQGRDAISHQMLLQAVCICDLALTSKETPFSTATGLHNEGAFYLYRLPEHNTFDFRDEFSVFFFKIPCFYQLRIFTNMFSNASSEIQVLLGFISMFFKGLYIGLLVAPNIYWKAPFPWTSQIFLFTVYH